VPKKKSLEEERREQRKAASLESQNMLTRIFVGKGRLRGNYYLVCDKNGTTAGLVITLQARDKKGAIATAKGRQLKQGGLKYSKGVVLFREKGGRLVFQHRSGRLTASTLKKAFKKILIQEYGITILKKAFVSFKDDAAKKKGASTGDASAQTGASDEEAVDSQTTNFTIRRADLNLTESTEKRLLSEMKKDPDLAALFNDDSTLPERLAEANTTLNKTFFNATIELAVDMADYWWGDPKKKGWKPPPLQFPTLEDFKSRSRSEASKSSYIEQERFSQEKMDAMWADVKSQPAFYKEHYNITDRQSLEQHWSDRKTTQGLDKLWKEWTSDTALSKRWAKISPRDTGQKRKLPKITEKPPQLLAEIRSMSDNLKMLDNFKTLNRKRLRKLIRYIGAYGEATGKLSNEMVQVREAAIQRRKNFQRVERIKLVVDENRIPYNQAEEAYLTQLYVDAARAQMRLKHITEDLFPKNDSKYEVKVPGAHHIKGTERARVKAQENEEGSDSNFATLGDLARGSIYFNSLEDIVDGMKTFIRGLPAESIIPKFKNRFAKGNHYRDIIITITLDNNHVTEMQFHSKAIADIKSHGATVSAPADQKKLQNAVKAIRKLRAEPPLDTRDILTQIETGTDWGLSGHDFYNITRWISQLKGTESIITMISSVGDQMYDDAFEAAKIGLDQKKIKALEELTLETVQSWRSKTRSRTT
jgi:hypothetical protein